MNTVRFTAISMALTWVLLMAACGDTGGPPLLCLPGASSCQNGIPAVCNASGQQHLIQEACGNGEVCLDGACVVDEVFEDVEDGDVPQVDTHLDECEVPDDCNKFLGSIGPCNVAVCDSGSCGVEPAEEGSSCVTGSGEEGEGVCLAEGCVTVICASGSTVCADEVGEDGHGVWQCSEFGDSATLLQETCDDGTVCNGEEACEAGICVSDGEDLDCDDEDPCTVDTCDPVDGCTNSVSDGECEDGNLCTEGDVCVDGDCVSGTDVDCFDDNICTSDSCDMFNGCVYALQNEGQACNDGDLCSSGDSCKFGECIPAFDTDCDDDNICTIESCESDVGCIHLAVEDGEACDDANTCTLTESCLSGICTVLEGNLLECDDSNPCTVDSCDSVDGCQNVNEDGVVCDDGDGCTEGDVCQAGTCEPGEPVLSTDCGAPANALCGVTGDAGAFVICDFRLVRGAEEGQAPVGLQLSVSYDNTVVKLIQFQDAYCVGEGEDSTCEVMPVPTPSTGAIDTGHTLAINPVLVEDWEGSGILLLYKFASDAILSDAWMSGSVIEGDSEVFQVLLQTLEDATTPSYFLLSDIVGTDSEANSLDGTVQDGVIIVE